MLSGILIYTLIYPSMQALGHEFDDDEFHAYVHGRLPYDALKPDLVLRNLLLSMPQRKIVSQETIILLRLFHNNVSLEEIPASCTYIIASVRTDQHVSAAVFRSSLTLTKHMQLKFSAGCAWKIVLKASYASKLLTLLVFNQLISLLYQMTML